MSLILHTDGGARGNPGPGAAGIVVENEAGEVVKELGIFLGHCTNNEAEYKALIKGLGIVKELGASSVSCFLDSELVVRQLNGQYKVKNLSMRKFFDEVAAIRKTFEHIEFLHVPREKNKDADKLVNEVLDANK
uniref:Ribonuclease HI family protein n=1 Tax=candidate division WWE3 bacterium TaxID=2053526 RepID=A0A7C4TIW9_UNCKA